ncbi:hypothetical protein L484_015279 [Morus notabilis]|uniref:Uncharacterized protein n=1 Tax=Morus notabilis TaxID=981085 RepID=W9S701_9ROSA|nr:hypothetical protein L484_015279 [Morus notabilis]
MRHAQVNGDIGSLTTPSWRQARIPAIPLSSLLRLEQSPYSGESREERETEGGQANETDLQRQEGGIRERLRRESRLTAAGRDGGERERWQEREGDEKNFRKLWWVALFNQLFSGRNFFIL